MYFEKIHIIKPSAGSLANSEVYIVGINKKEHLSEHNRKILFNVLENIDMDKFLFDNFPDLFIDEINKIVKSFIKIQDDFLQKSFYYYDNPKILEKDNEKFYNAKMKYVNKWINNNNFKLIEDTL